MGVLGASGNALYCWPVSVAPTQTQPPNGLSSPPCWGRFFELSFYKGRRLEWSDLISLLARRPSACAITNPAMPITTKNTARISRACSINLADDMFCR